MRRKGSDSDNEDDGVCFGSSTGGGSWTMGVIEGETDIIGGGFDGTLVILLFCYSKIFLCFYFSLYSSFSI